jgi:hypothetical protein
MRQSYVYLKLNVKLNVMQLRENHTLLLGAFVSTDWRSTVRRTDHSVRTVPYRTYCTLIEGTGRHNDRPWGRTEYHHLLLYTVHTCTVSTRINHCLYEDRLTTKKVADGIHTVGHTVPLLTVVSYRPLIADRGSSAQYLMTNDSLPLEKKD